MQMSDMLALVQVLLGVASLIVAILAQIRENSPKGVPFGAPFFRQERL